MTPFISFLIFGFVVISFISSLLFLSSLLGPKRNSKVKQQPFECGISSNDDTLNHRIAAGYYVVSILFIIFDAAIVILYPWAAAFEDLGSNVFYYILAFIGILSIVFIYSCMKGVLNLNGRSTRR